MFDGVAIELFGILSRVVSQVYLEEHLECLIVFPDLTLIIGLCSIMSSGKNFRMRYLIMKPATMPPIRAQIQSVINTFELLRVMTSSLSSPQVSNSNMPFSSSLLTCYRTYALKLDSYSFVSSFHTSLWIPCPITCWRCLS